VGSPSAAALLASPSSWQAERRALVFGPATSAASAAFIAFVSVLLLDWFSATHFDTGDCFFFDSGDCVDTGDCVVALLFDFPPRRAPKPTAAAATTTARMLSGTTRRGFRYHSFLRGSLGGRELSEAGAAGRRPDRGRRAVGVAAAPPASEVAGVDARALSGDDTGGGWTAAWGSIPSGCECRACVAPSSPAGGIGWPHSLQYS
jgi:hypothetical protein